MTDAKPQKRKITVIASTKGTEQANKALLRHRFESIADFAKKSPVSRTTITKFFNRRSIQVDSFKRICDDLQLDDWRNIVQSSTPDGNTSLKDAIGAVLRQQKKYRQQVVLSDPAMGQKVVVVVDDDASSIDNQLKVVLQLALQNRAKGSPSGVAWLIEQVQSGKLTEIVGHEIKEIQVFQESLDGIKEDKPSEKWRLIEPIQRCKRSKSLLCDTDLSDTNLSRTDLSESNLSRAILSGADLCESNLRRAKLNRADLSDANLSRANLSHADLSDAILRRAILRRVDLSGANLSGADLRRAFFSGVNFGGVNLSGANLRLINLSSARLSGVDLSGANLSGADLSGASLRLISLSSATLSHTDLRGANLSDADLSNANLSGANLGGAFLPHANLSSANLAFANVANAFFGNNQGISESLKQNLIQRGAIFEDSPGNRSRSHSPC